MNQKRIIVYNTGALGDLLVSTAALRSISSLFPSSPQTLLGNSIWRSLLLPSEWPDISSFIECERKDFKKLILYRPNLVQNNWEKTAEITDLLKYLKDYEIGINLRTSSLRFAIALFQARVKIRIGAHNSRFARWLFTHFTRESNTPTHKRDSALNVLSAYQQNFAIEQHKYWKLKGLPLLKQIDTQNFKNQFGTSFILINPTASIREKAMPAQKFKEIINILVKNNQNPVVVGAPNETEWLKEVASDKAPIYQSKSIFDTYDLIASAKLLVTNTSALQFISASTGTPTITLMGIANPIIWGPLGQNDKVIKVKSTQDNNPFHIRRYLNKAEWHKDLEKMAYARISALTVLDTINELSV